MVLYIRHGSLDSSLLLIVNMKRFSKLLIAAAVFGSLFVSTTEIFALTTTQIESILALVRSFGVSESVVQGVYAAFSGQMTPAAPMPPVTTVASPVSVLSPNGGEELTQGQGVSISWKGGTGKVQIGIVNSQFSVDSTVLGWVTTSGKPDGSVLWDGTNVWDITGTMNEHVSNLPAGPYKVIAVSEGKNKQFCATEGCNYDLSDTDFTMTAPNDSKTLSVICVPSITEIETGATVTWFADVQKGKQPYTYSWSGTDGVAALPTRKDAPKFLDAVYYSPGIKTAGVKVFDASGEEYHTACKLPVVVHKKSSALSLLKPMGGEKFYMTQAYDQSQAIRVTWKLQNGRLQKKDIKIALIDSEDRSCQLAVASSTPTERLVPIISGFWCPGGWRLAPGEHRLKVTIETPDTFVAAVSSPFTLLPPVVPDTVQSVTPSKAAVKSSEAVKFSFIVPANTVRASLYLHCPNGVEAATPNLCNRSTDVSSYVASSSPFSVTFVNGAAASQTVTANFYTYLPNNPNYGRGVQTSVSVASVEASRPTDIITVLTPNGGESLKHGATYTFTYKMTEPGSVDLALVPHPTIDASKVCTIATDILGVATTSARYVFTVPSDGACGRGPAPTISGSYKLFASLKLGSTKRGSDLSDAAFTVAASSTPAQ